MLPAIKVYQSTALTSSDSLLTELKCNAELHGLAMHILNEIKNTNIFPNTNSDQIHPPEESPFTWINVDTVDLGTRTHLRHNIENLPNTPLNGSDEWVEKGRREDWYSRAEGGTALVLSAIRQYSSQAQAPEPPVVVVVEVVEVADTATAEATPITTPAAQAEVLVAHMSASARPETTWVKEYAKASEKTDYGWPARTQIDHSDLKINSDKTLNENFAILLERCLTDLNKTLFFNMPIKIEAEVSKKAHDLKLAFAKWLLVQPQLDKIAEYPVKNEEGQNKLTLAMLLGKLNTQEGDKALEELIRNDLVSQLGDKVLNSDGTVNPERLKGAQKEASRKKQ